MRKRETGYKQQQQLSAFSGVKTHSQQHKTGVCSISRLHHDDNDLTSFIKKKVSTEGETGGTRYQTESTRLKKETESIKLKEETRKEGGT